MLSKPDRRMEASKLYRVWCFKMKIRQGFVSNSSTSSFVCAACGGLEAGRDMCINDFEMFCCENHHYIHESCAGWPNLEPPEEYVRSYMEKYHSGDNITEEQLADLKYEYLYEIPHMLCPVCNFKKLSAKDELAYYRYKLGTTKEKTLEEISKEFVHYKDFCSKIY